MNNTDLSKKRSEFLAKYKAFRAKISDYKPLLSSKLIPISEALIKYQDNVDCKKGCSYCCNYRVSAYTHEIIAIYIHIKTTYSEPQLVSINKKIADTASRISKLTKQEHFRTNIQCPFLVDGGCSIYKVRPSACAGYYSTKSEGCEYLFNNPQDEGSAAPGIYQLDMEVKQEKAIMSSVLIDLKHDSDRYELNTSILKLFNKPALISKWRKTGKPIF